jgi:hypothetical protein
VYPHARRSWYYLLPVLDGVLGAGVRTVIWRNRRAGLVGPLNRPNFALGIDDGSVGIVALVGAAEVVVAVAGVVVEVLACELSRLRLDPTDGDGTVVAGVGVVAVVVVCCAALACIRLLLISASVGGSCISSLL